LIVFDFVTDEDLRKSLESDAQEMSNCFGTKAWKAVHILGGAMIEAVLVDHLLATSHKEVAKADVLNMDLGQLLEVCKKDKILSAKTVALSTAVKAYRNLIHPGRALRLNDTPNEEGATVVRALLNMVVQEVANRQKDEYGYTAEQLVSKLERDSSVLPILPHLLKGMRQAELRRLLLSAAPRRYFELDPEEIFGAHDPDIRPRIAACFRTAFDIAPEQVKQLVAMNFVTVLKEKNRDEVLEYETAFFRASDLAYLDVENREMAKQHLLSRLKEELSAPLLEALAGIADHLKATEIRNVLDPFIKAAYGSKPQHLQSRAREFITDL
jgi:hypothetical protein